MSKYIIASEEGVVFLKVKTHVINSVARCTNRPYSCAFDRKDLSVTDVLLEIIWLVLVNLRRQDIVIGYKIGDSARVISMPMCQ